MKWTFFPRNKRVTSEFTELIKIFGKMRRKSHQKIIL